MPRVVLLGTMGSGKTTVGRALAARLGWRYWDNDAELRARHGRGAREIAAADGVERLHDVEAAVLAAGLALAEPAVVAAPGSVALRRPVIEGAVVWLRADPATLAARLGSGGDRPDLGAVAAVDAARRPGFAALATAVVDVDGRTVDEVVAAVLAAVGLAGDAAAGEEIGASGQNSSHPSVTVAGCDSPQDS